MIHPLAVECSILILQDGLNLRQAQASCNPAIPLAPLQKAILFLAPGFHTLMVSVGGLMEEWSLHDPTIPKLPIWQYLHLHNQTGTPCGRQHL